MQRGESRYREAAGTCIEASGNPQPQSESDLTRKARLVPGRHKNRDVPAYATYSSVASRESIRMAFLIAAMNSMDVLAANIGNTYLNAPCRLDFEGA